MISTAKEYATALFMLAQENGQMTAYAEALHTIEGIFAQQPAYVELLRSPGIPQTERLALLQAAFADAVPRTVFALLHLLCKNEHMHVFSDCVKAYTEMLESANRVSTGQVTSAVPLTAEDKAALSAHVATLCGHRVSLQYTTDPTLIGGVTVEIDGKIIDGSLKRRLREMKEVIAK